jgi:glutathione synthase/RimK-type ligase-like ATP-grasp enzyme
VPSPDFTFATYDGLPDLDPDDRLAVDALARRGLRAVPAVWNSPDVDWAAGGICVIRSTWDYHLDYAGFLAWADRVAAVAPLWNPPRIVRWNSNKRYLEELERRGAPVVPTAWLAARGRSDLGALLRNRGWSRAVVKPVVGLATRNVMMVDGTAAGIARAQAHVDMLLADQDVMVQPYVDSVDSYGERALVFIDGEYSHAARKTAFQPLAVAGEAGETAAVAEADEIEVATRVAGMVDGALYARVDLVRDASGKPIVIEFELVEPSLFLGLYPPAAERFASALADLL